MTDDLPIDIHSSKLLDWLVNRRHCNKDWQKNVLNIREKIKHAIKDMPESEEIVQLLQRSFINYFHCTQIIDILKDTEKDSKNFLGYYSSQRMKDWQEIESMYRRENVHLAESAQILQRLVQYEIPALKRQIAKSDQAVVESVKKEKDYLRQAEESKKLYEKELASRNLKGKSLRSELLSLAADLPSLFDSIAGEVISLEKAREYYIHFRNYMHREKAPSSPVLPLIEFLIQHGSSVTSYEWKYKQKPTRIEPHNFELLLKEEKSDSNDDNDDIDFGEQEGIDFGDDIDFGAEGVIDVIADDTGAVGEHVASGEDAMGIVENPGTQRQLKMELEELLQFLQMRSEDEQRETASDLFIRTIEKRPAQLEQVTGSVIAGWIESITSILGKFNDPQNVHLFKIRASPQFVEKLVSDLEMKRGLEARYKRLAALMLDKQKEASQTVVSNNEELKRVVENTRKLQKQIEEAISQKYNGRRVNIMGGISTVLANV